MIIIFCEKYFILVSTYTTRHVALEALCSNASLDGAWSFEEKEGGVTQKIGRKMKVGCQVEEVSK